MCYFLYLSTDDNTDLTAHNSELVRFDRNLDQGEEVPLDVLQFAHKWYVASKTGCSCTFRQFCSTEGGFDVPQEWCYEEPDAIQATQQFYDVVAELIGRGKHVDCLSWWVDSPVDKIVSMNLGLTTVSKETFLFLENRHYIFSGPLKAHDQRP
ncbi:MAG: hypothetical protein A2Z25_18050 [Planctomycetes bacterium RBG_16_55_9]|nr:MAG: hypothetical protein A2Z25_18050 [Planctomycetes bacterium RBG_16_55_9]